MRTQERIAELMGTTAHVIVTGAAPGVADQAVDRLHELEARWSRFRPDSEISRLNQRPRVPVLVSADTYTLLERAVDGWRLTEGLFDPTLLRELRAVGYDRSFELLEGDALSRASRPVARPDRGGAASIGLDPVIGTVRFEAGVEIDPGGIGKGLAADLVVEMLRAEGAAGAMVNVGGDLRAEGDAPDGTGWMIAVADPNAPDRVIETLVLGAGAVASTWSTKRMWTVDGEVRHHLLDPDTGAPADRELAGVTVVSDQGWRAEVLAKAVFLADPDAADELLASNAAAGLAIAHDGSTRPLGDLASFILRPEEASQ